MLRFQPQIYTVEDFKPPYLYEKCKKVNKIDFEEVSFEESPVMIANHLSRILKECKGLGLAANQIGFNKAIFAMMCGASVYSPTVDTFVNPEIVGSKDSLMSIEGCLSIPGKFYKVKRFKTIDLKSLDLRGEETVKRYSDLEAIVIQHEIDHLNGTLISDVGELHASF